MNKTDSYIVAALLVGGLMCAPAIAASLRDCEELERQIKKTESTRDYAKHHMRPGEAANAIYSADMRIKRYRKQYSEAGCDQPAAMLPGQPRPAERNSINQKACLDQCRQYSQHSDQQCFSLCWGK